MSTSRKIQERFQELVEQSTRLICHTTDDGIIWYEADGWRRWATSAEHIIESVFGSASVHARHFAVEYGRCHGREAQVHSMRGILRAAKDDYESGYAVAFTSRISGEVYGDFIALAKAALDVNCKDAAAVLACAALEDALKRFAALNELQVGEKSMQEVVAALKAKGLVSGAQKSILDVMPKIRDYAMHANWEKLTVQDVGSVIGFTEQLLLQHFA